MIDVLHCVDQAVMSRVAANALLRSHEFWPQGDVAVRADQACERRSAPLVRSESRRPSHPKACSLWTVCESVQVPKLQGKAPAS